MNVLPPPGFVDWLLSPSNLLIAARLLIGVVDHAVSPSAGCSEASRAEPSATPPAAARNKKRLDDMASRWQLLLLGATGFVLSLASGYTTWDGMTNFTGETMLSLMVTFGIQGVMLIVAWLIGESFATGMNRRLPDGRPAGRADAADRHRARRSLVVAIAFYLAAASAAARSAWPRPARQARSTGHASPTCRPISRSA